MKFQAIKGVRDILPPESALWNRVEQTARDVFGTFGFAEIRLPIIEYADLFARAVGEETDIVSKEMYSFEDRASGELTMLRQSALNPKSFAGVKGNPQYVRDIQTYRVLLQKSMDKGDIPVS